MAKHQVNPAGCEAGALDPIWDRVRQRPRTSFARPELASFIYSTVLHHARLEESVVHRIAERSTTGAVGRLDSSDL